MIMQVHQLWVHSSARAGLKLMRRKQQYDTPAHTIIVPPPHRKTIFGGSDKQNNNSIKSSCGEQLFSVAGFIDQRRQPLQSRTHIPQHSNRWCNSVYSIQIGVSLGATAVDTRTTSCQAMIVGSIHIPWVRDLQVHGTPPLLDLRSCTFQTCVIFTTMGCNVTIADAP